MIFQASYNPLIMNHQDTITISGVVFHVENSCRQLLNNFLERTLKAEQQRIQEERLAEILLDELKEEGKQIVTQAEVDHLIQKTKHLRMPD